MKKILLILSFIALACNMQAQVVTIKDGGLYGCPKEFTKNNVGVVYSLAGKVATIYDSNFNVVKTFECKVGDGKDNYIADIVEDCIIDGADGGCHNSALTQTFFNDDEKWEYIVSVEGYREGKWTEEYFVYNEDGECLLQLPYEPDGIIVNDGKKYLVLVDSNDTAYIYNMENGLNKAFGINIDPAIVGKWAGSAVVVDDDETYVQEFTYEFKENGTYIQTLLGAHTATRTGNWKIDGNGNLVLYDEYYEDVFTYTIDGDTATITVNGMSIKMTRVVTTR